MPYVVRKEVHFECICAQYDMAIRAFIRPQSGGLGWGLRLDRIRRDYPMALQGVSIEPIESRVGSVQNLSHFWSVARSG